ncbi:helix-turn-helix domain-containing protein [Pedobacter punctiformis]|uniref:AraC family transcriptional regulator n=1 Tax=Pedobacter punctiformis TaxID=3004097 RepID=A0ABT4L422_9SPHI|nr:AraC family transcriptional regulator [Pedobacter sp. HCMS5-2]MCZ4242676.1 AraC family transcriptional regulator [Pedobacter sp. HCMS5-2]
MFFFQYLKLMRMTKAMEKLLESDLIISEIAYSVGYKGIPSFSSTFSKMFGKRSSEFKDSKHTTLIKL